MDISYPYRTKSQQMNKLHIKEERKDPENLYSQINANNNIKQKYSPVYQDSINDNINIQNLYKPKICKNVKNVKSAKVDDLKDHVLKGRVFGYVG